MQKLLEGVLFPDADSAGVLAASQRIRNTCGWHIAPSVRETLTMPWASRLFLPSLHVTAVHSVTVDGTPVDFDWARNGEVWLSHGRYGRRGLRSVAVDLTHGYSPCPDDVVEAVRRLVQAGTEGRLKTTTTGPFGDSYFDIDTSDSLDAYKLPVVA